MSFWKRKANSGTRAVPVQVVFRDLKQIHRPIPGTGGAYTYLWKLDRLPQIGDWVMVPSNGKLNTAIVVALTRGEGSAGVQLSYVESFVDEDKWLKAFEKYA